MRRFVKILFFAETLTPLWMAGYINVQIDRTPFSFAAGLSLIIDTLTPITLLSKISIG